MNGEGGWHGERPIGAGPGREPSRPAETRALEVLERIALEGLREQRRARRWGIFFKLVFLAYLVVLLAVLVDGREAAAPLPGGRHTALVELEGPIAPDTPASADNVVRGLRAAFGDERTAGVILRINSPGGSPVQAGQIYEEIRRLRERHPKIPLYAVVTDIAASGAYYVAAAADEIYADKASLVGSIGVLMDGFGFVEAMRKLGIERRLLTSGERKGFLDPFSPADPDDLAHMKRLLKQVHEQFIHAVREGRGDRLKDDPRIFSGLIWTGEESVRLGLVDGLGSADYVAREIIGAERIVDFTPKEDFLERFTERLGLAVARGLARLGAGALR